MSESRYDCLLEQNLSGTVQYAGQNRGVTQSKGHRGQRERERNVYKVREKRIGSNRLQNRTEPLKQHVNVFSTFTLMKVLIRNKTESWKKAAGSVTENLVLDWSQQGGRACWGPSETRIPDRLPGCEAERHHRRVWAGPVRLTDRTTSGRWGLSFKVSPKRLPDSSAGIRKTENFLWSERFCWRSGCSGTGLQLVQLPGSWTSSLGASPAPYWETSMVLSGTTGTLVFLLAVAPGHSRGFHTEPER